MYGNILKGIINTLAAKEAGVSDESSTAIDVDGSNSYYTSWMRVVGTNATEPSICGKNQIRVVLYGNDEVPSRKNFVPCELMAIARWGCINYADPEDPNYEEVLASIERRQQLFYISTSEGRIAKLIGVNKPILEDFNYGTTLGVYPEFVKSWSIANRLIEGYDYLYAQGVIVSDFIKVDSLGRPLINYVDCGEWINGGAEGVTPAVGQGIYLCNEKNNESLQWETHDVWHNGLKWRCLQHQPYNNVYYEPKWRSNYWKPIEGDMSLTMEFVSSNGYSFRIGAINTTITAHVFFGGIEITNATSGVNFVGWTRCTESRWNDGEPHYTTQDEAWNAQHNHDSTISYDPRTLQLSTTDMPSDWSPSNKAIFTCKAIIDDGKNTIIVENRIIS